MDGVVFWTVVAARILVPLAIPRFPLPAMLAALIIDVAVARRILQKRPHPSVEGFAIIGTRGSGGGQLARRCAYRGSSVAAIDRKLPASVLR